MPGMIDFNEWLLFNERRRGGGTAGAAADADASATGEAQYDFSDGADGGAGRGGSREDEWAPLALTYQPASFLLPPLAEEGAVPDAVSGYGDDAASAGVGMNVGMGVGMGMSPHLSSVLPPAASASAARVLAVVQPAEIEAAAASTTGPKPPPLEYLQTMLARSSSREVADELGVDSAASLSADVLEAASAFVAMEGDERNAMLTPEQFEAALVGHTMTAGDAEVRLARDEHLLSTL